jgi:hypothetical protein
MPVGAVDTAAKPPIHWIGPIRDSAPAAPAFDPSVLHRPGYRTPQMVRDARRWLDSQAACGDPAHAARAERIARQSVAWRDWQININYNTP